MRINRRGVLTGVASVLMLPAAAAVQCRVEAIAWRGYARVFQGDTVLDLTICTRVEPFRRAGSTSWITNKGKATARTLVIEPTDGWLEQGGRRKPLSPALISHERQQYGLYGYLLRAANASGRGPMIEMAEPGFPPIRLEMANGRVAAADCTVGSPDDGSPLSQHIVFDGALESADPRWFRRMTISQAGQRYFERIHPPSPALPASTAPLLWARLGAILSARLGVVDGSGGGLLAGRAASAVE